MKKTPKLHVIIFAFIMTYLIGAIIVFIAEMYYRLSDSIPSLRTIWCFEFVDKWHWAIIIVFISYTMLSFLIGHYMFSREMNRLFIQHQKQQEKYVEDVKTHFESRIK